MLRAENDRFRVVDEGIGDDGHKAWVILDDDGPVIATVCPEEVQLQPPRGYTGIEDRQGVGFAAMWRYCQIIADAEHCIAYDPDDDELVDLTLPEGEARRRYNWL